MNGDDESLSDDRLQNDVIMIGVTTSCSRFDDNFAGVGALEKGDKRVRHLVEAIDHTLRVLQLALWRKKTKFVTNYGDKLESP